MTRSLTSRPSSVSRRKLLRSNKTFSPSEKYSRNAGIGKRLRGRRTADGKAAVDLIDAQR